MLINLPSKTVNKIERGGDIGSTGKIITENLALKSKGFIRFMIPVWG